MTTSHLTDGGPGAMLSPREHECPFHPPAKLGELREHQPISRVKLPDGHLCWLVTTHELCRAVLGDARFTNLPGGLPQLEPARQAAIVRHAIEHEDAFPSEI